MPDFSNIRIPTTILALAGMMNAQETTPDGAKQALEEKYAAVLGSNEPRVLDRALVLAAKDKDKDAVRFLLDKHANPNIYNRAIYETPLVVAVRNKDKDMIDLLIAGGADVNFRVGGETALFRAESPEIAEQLLRAGAAANIPDSKGDTALHHVAEVGSLEMLELYARYGKIEEGKLSVNANGITPFGKVLQQANYLKSYDEETQKKLEMLLPPAGKLDEQCLQMALEINPHAVNFLLERGANPNSQPKSALKEQHKGTSPLEMIAWKMATNPLTNAEALIAKGANVHLRDAQGQEPFEIAIKRRNVEFAEYLMTKGVSNTTLNADGKPMIGALLERFEMAHPDLLEQLNKVESKSDEGNNRAAFSQMQQTKFVREDIELGKFLRAAANGTLSPVNRVSEEVVAPLGRAPQREEKRLVSGAPEPVYQSIKTDGLYEAVRTGDKAALGALLTGGRDVQARYDVAPRNVSLLHVAAKYGQDEMVKNLIERGVNVNSADGLGQTPLHYAIENGHTDLVKQLLQSGANPDKASDLGWNAAHYAVRSGDLAMLKEVLKSNVDLEHKDASGNRPFDLAIAHMKDGDTRYAFMAGVLSAAMKSAPQELPVLPNVKSPGVQRQR